jgi:hypothetical protein
VATLTFQRLRHWGYRRIGTVVAAAVAAVATACGSPAARNGAGSTVPASSSSVPLNAPAPTTVVPPPTLASLRPGCPASPMTGVEKIAEGERIRAVIPAGWDVRISRAPAEGTGSTSEPFLIAGNFPLPVATSPFGSGAFGSMGPTKVFVSLSEYGAASVGKALFAHQGLPCPLTANQFDPNAMQPSVAGMAGTQRFFTDQRRAFALYAVVGSYVNRDKLVPLVNSFLARVNIQPPA